MSVRSQRSTEPVGRVALFSIFIQILNLRFTEFIYHLQMGCTILFLGYYRGNIFRSCWIMLDTNNASCTRLCTDVNIDLSRSITVGTLPWE